jgi:sarcosine oxidase
VQTTDTIVIGLGAMGSAATYQLARRGVTVRSFETYLHGHSRGSYHGNSRLIRKVYPKPEYVPLVDRAFQLWHRLEEETGRRLLTMSGALGIGLPGSNWIEGARKTAIACGLSPEVLTADEVIHRFPGFRPRQDHLILFDPDAGILYPEDCVAGHLDVAKKYGALLHYTEPVLSWKTSDAGVEVRTPSDTYRAGRLIITAGAWSQQMLSVTIPLEVRRQVIAHFQPIDSNRFGLPACPVFSWEVQEGHFFGSPDVSGQGLKIGRHDGGLRVSPDDVPTTIDPSSINELRAFLDEYMPGSAGELVQAYTCLYTMTPDSDFVIGSSGSNNTVVYACGFSGHGFKFAGVIGEILADLSTSGKTGHDIRLFDADRFGKVSRPSVQ